VPAPRNMYGRISSRRAIYEITWSCSRSSQSMRRNHRDGLEHGQYAPLRHQIGRGDTLGTIQSDDIPSRLPTTSMARQLNRCRETGLLLHHLHRVPSLDSSSAQGLVSDDTACTPLALCCDASGRTTTAHWRASSRCAPGEPGAVEKRSNETVRRRRHSDGCGLTPDEFFSRGRARAQRQCGMAALVLQYREVRG
jgi:hypothetical protein